MIIICITKGSFRSTDVGYSNIGCFSTLTEVGEDLYRFLYSHSGTRLPMLLLMNTSCDSFIHLVITVLQSEKSTIRMAANSEPARMLRIMDEALEILRHADEMPARLERWLPKLRNLSQFVFHVVGAVEPLQSTQSIPSPNMSTSWYWPTTLTDQSMLQRKAKETSMIK